MAEFRFEDWSPYQQLSIVRATARFVSRAREDKELWARVQEQKKIYWITGRFPLPEGEEQFCSLIQWLEEDPTRMDMASEETKAQIMERLAMVQA